MRRLVLLSALLLAACTGTLLNAVPPRVSVADIDLRSLGLFEQKFDVGLRVVNPNRFDFRIEGLDFELEVNGKPFARGLTRLTTLVAASSSSVVRVEAFTQSRSFIEQVRTLTPDALKNGVPYRIVGRVKIDRASDWLPFDHKGVYGGDAPKKAQRT